MKRIFVPTVSGSDWQRLLGKPELHWKSGRSAMSAAACWEENEPHLPGEIAGVLEASGDESLASLELLVAIPEWEVDLPGGDRPSQTDVLAITRNELGLVILGVEAKVDEPFGPTLGERKASKDSEVAPTPYSCGISFAKPWHVHALAYWSLFLSPHAQWRLHRAL